VKPCGKVEGTENPFVQGYNARHSNTVVKSTQRFQRSSFILRGFFLQ
jgi:hypothetical protein